MRTNFQEIALVMAVNHVAFNSLGEGKHKFVQTPDQVSDVASGANEPVLYAKTTGNAGVLQYSRGPSNAIPTPLTSLHSSGAVSSVANVFDFTGLTLAMAMLYAFTGNSKAVYFVWWDGATLRVNQVSTGAALSVSASGNILQITTGSNFYWTLDFIRTS